MSGLLDYLHQTAAQTKGRCHSCTYQHSYELPTGTRFWCRAFDREMTEGERDVVRDCDRWKPIYVKHKKEKSKVKGKERLFWALGVYLAAAGVDLKTLMMISGDFSDDDISLAQSTTERYFGQDPGSLKEIIGSLKQAECISLAELVEKELMPSA